jgi:Protein of unknown function (DUF3800)
MINIRHPLVYEIWLMLLEAYFDDSGKESDRHNRVVCIAGYMSPTGFWNDFNQKWEGTLLQHGLTELHMKLWGAIKKEKGWANAKADAVLNDFIDIIRGAKLWGFGAGVDADQWRALPRNKQKLFGSAQEFVMQRVFRLIIDEIRTHQIAAHLNIVFDQDEGYSKPRLTRFFGVKRIDPLAKRHAAIISFADAKVCYSLQAADLLAYLTRKRLMEREEGTSESTHWLRLMTPAPDLEHTRYKWDGWFGPSIEAELDKAAQEVITPL